MTMTRVVQRSSYYEQIDLEDLHKQDSSQGIALNLQNTRGPLDGVGDVNRDTVNLGVSLVRLSRRSDPRPMTFEAEEEMPAIATGMAASIAGWTQRLEQVSGTVSC